MVVRVILIWLAAAGAAGVFAGDIEFNRDVRPILSGKCFHCHGPDSHNREADLRLDIREGATAERKGKRAIDPDNLSASELVRRIHATDPDDVMPPPESKKSLSKAEIQILEKWVKSGAEYRPHWAFIAPQKAAVPKFLFDRWSRNEIDGFVLSRLKAADLKPQPEAERATLLRRASFDLTGLPPTPEELTTYLADGSKDAYEKAVDRLLASPHFGERMTLAWMDAARYGDSSVMHADGPRFMWPWRDWVIGAYNSNMPFNQFATEQLAGDLIANATPEQKLATGFNRNNATSDEGGAFPEELRVEYVVDRVRTTANVFLGLTMECAQCHDHKFDPISQEEYYQFFAFFNNNADPGMQTRNGNQAPIVQVSLGERSKQLAEIETERKNLQAVIDGYAAKTGGAVDAWVKQKEQELAGGKLAKPMPGGLIHHMPLDETAGAETQFSDFASTARGKLAGKHLADDRNGNSCIQLDGSTVIDFDGAGEAAEYNQPFTLASWIKPNGPGNGAVFAKMNSSQNYRGYDLWLQSGAIGSHIINTWPNNAVKVVSKAKVKPNTWQHVATTYDGSGKAAGVRIYIDGKLQENVVEQDDLTETIQTDVAFRIGARTSSSNFIGAVDEVRMYNRALSIDEIGLLLDGGDALESILRTPADQRTDGQRKTLSDLYLSTNDEGYRKLTAALADLGKREAEVNKKFPEVDSMVMADNPPAKLRKTYLLERGHYASPRMDKEITPGVPSFLPAMPPGVEANRLGMAEWLMQPSHPLTARVAVNRYWAMLFGRGLVSSVMDFGNQGAAPTNAELLDWLAVDFVENGWDSKRIIRKMVTSATYRQSVRVTPNALAADPENRLLSRGPRFRLQGEFIRDNALATSGLLNSAIGGASVKPSQPPGIWNEVSLDGGLRYTQDKGSDLYRRSMYTYWKRSAPAPNMVIFDAPSREKCVVERARTNTPLQALVTLNDVQFTEASRVLAERVMKEGGATFAERLSLAYRLCLTREPTAEESAICRQVYEQQLASFTAAPEDAGKYLAAGEAPRDAKLDVVEHAAYTVLMNMLLNLDEVLTRG